MGIFLDVLKQYERLRSCERPAPLAQVAPTIRSDSATGSLELGRDRTRRTVYFHASNGAYPAVDSTDARYALPVVVCVQK